MIATRSRHRSVSHRRGGGAQSGERLTLGARIVDGAARGTSRHDALARSPPPRPRPRPRPGPHVVQDRADRIAGRGRQRSSRGAGRHDTGGPRRTGGAERSAARGPQARGHHRVRARQRHARAAVPRPVEGRRSRSTSPTSSARATRATARPAWRTCSSTCCSRARRSTPRSGSELQKRGAHVQRVDLVRPHELLRDDAGQGRQPRVGARARGRSHGQLRTSRRRGPRQGVLGRPQRVRDRREQPGRACSSERMWSTAYLWHNYGKSTIGSRADIERVPATTLRGFYKKYYQPDNAVLVVAGKFDAPQALGADQRALRRAAAARRARSSRPTPASRCRTASASVTLRRVGDVQVVGAHRTTAAAGLDPDCAAPTRSADVLTNEPSGRLYKALVKTGLATSVCTSRLPLHDPGVIEMFRDGARRASRSSRCATKMIEIVEGLAQGRRSPTRRSRAFKAQGARRVRSCCSRTPRARRSRCREFIGAGDWRLLFLHRDRVARR